MPSEEPSARAPGVLDHLKAAFVAFHVAAVVFMALPAADGGMNRSAWKDPTVQAEFEAWAGRLTAMGVETTPEELEDWGWEFASSYSDMREVVLDPLDPYYRYLGARQSWQMFVAPHRNPAKLAVEVRQDGAWEMVYLSRDPEARWRAHQLDHTRTRSVLFRYAWKHYRKYYKQLGEWLAREAAEDFPEASAVRVSWWRYRTLSPEDVRAGKQPEIDVERMQVHRLAKLRDGEGE